MCVMGIKKVELFVWLITFNAGSRLPFFVGMCGTTPLEPYRVYIRYSQMSVNLLFLQKTSELSKFTETELALMHFLSDPSFGLFATAKIRTFFDIQKKM